MNQEERLTYLVETLAAEQPPGRCPIPADYTGKRKLLRSLMNLRPPAPISPRWLQVQDAFLQAEAEARGIVASRELPPVAGDPRLCLWQGDITRLQADAIVNAANSALLGCFLPCHGCIDNVIHSAAGLQLRQACHELMAAQGHPEPTGQAKITAAYNLPARHVIHTVGPVVRGPLTTEHRRLLASCYRSCLATAADHHCQTLAFCCISTGEFHFPHQEAAAIAVHTVQTALPLYPWIEKVIFNVFQEQDAAIYHRLLA